MICTPEAIASGVQIIVWLRFLYLCDGGWGEFYSTWKAYQKTPERLISLIFKPKISLV